jgi:cytidyltransferase-like protein
MPPVIVSGPFDDIRSPQLRFLEEAAKAGPVKVMLWDDAAIKNLSGKPPKFPLAERRYFLGAVRFVSEVMVHPGPPDPDVLSAEILAPQTTWAFAATEDSPARRAFCRQHGLVAKVICPEDLQGFPASPVAAAGSTRKKVIVTGCYDWFHSGHVRFFEEVSALGDLYVAVGNDANVRLLKGAGHPLLSQDERRYVAGSIRHVAEAMFTTGSGWLDAEPEIQRIKPDMYAVNEDGDKPEKRAYCEANGIQYVVLRRTPAPGLAARSSTNLRGF